MNLLTGSPDPKLFKFVERPDSVADSEVAKAQPVFISDLPTGGATATWATLEGKPATFPPVTGTGAAQAAPGNHVHTAGVVTATAVAGLTGTTVQAILNSIGAEIAALKAAA